MDNWILKLGKVGASTLFVLTLSASLTSAASTFSDRTVFSSTLATSITDDYQGAGYAPGENNPYLSNAAMSAVLGETEYTSTEHVNWNITSLFNGNRAYCAGCNGSFELSFTTTSIGSTDGVYGVGFGYRNDVNNPYLAFVTYGDGTTENLDLQSVNTPRDGTMDFFFGITSDLLIKTLHIGLINGGSTSQGSFLMDNLTIGSVSVVPLPAALPLYGAGLGLLGFLGWRRKRIRNAV